MTELDSRATVRGEFDGLPGREGPSETWRPYVHEAILTPQMALGPEDTDPADLQRLKRYLAELVVARHGPVHVNVAFNAIYFGFDLTTRSYVGGPLDLFKFPVVDVADTTDALPVGAMISIAVGATPLFAEVVYKEGAHPDLRADGSLPSWVSGAPAGAEGPGRFDEDEEYPVLWERLVVDFDAFGADLSRTRTQLDRLRRQGRALNSDGHLQLDARYRSREEAELDDVAFYVRYLLSRGRDQLLSAAAPLPLHAVLRDDAGDAERAAALFGILRTIKSALAELSVGTRDADLHMWGEYGFSRGSLRHRPDTGSVGVDDMRALAAQLRSSAIPSRPSRWGQQQPPTYTAVGPQLRGIHDVAGRLNGVGYALAVCHLNTVILSYIDNKADEETRLLPGEVHLRLDDRWQGGGVWRAEHPKSSYAAVDFAEPLGLGWLDSLPITEVESGEAPVGLALAEAVQEAAPEPDVMPEIHNDFYEDLVEVVLTDSQISWTQPLRLKHQLDRFLPVPDRVVAQMRSSGLNTGVRMRLQLTHDGYELDPRETTQHVIAELLSPPRLAGVDWPIEFFAGISLTCTWPRGGSFVRVTSTLLDVPITIDGEWDIEHRYDPRIITRDSAPGEPRSWPDRSRDGKLEFPVSQPQSLTLPQRVLRQIRRLGLLSPDGRAVLGYHNLPFAVFGDEADHRGGVIEELAEVVDDLVAADKLRADDGSVNEAQQLQYPAVTGQRLVPVIVYVPAVVTGLPRPARGRAKRKLDIRWVRSEPISRHLRNMTSSGRTASEEAREAWRRDRERLGLAGPTELPEYWTYVQPRKHGAE